MKISGCIAILYSLNNIKPIVNLNPTTRSWNSIIMVESERATTKGSLFQDAAEMAKKIKEQAKGFASQTGLTSELPEKFMNLRTSLIAWLTDLYERSDDEDEKNLLSIIRNKIDRVFKLDEFVLTYWVRKNPKKNKLEQQFNQAIARLEACDNSEVNTAIINAVKELGPDLEWFKKKTPCLEEHVEGEEYTNANIIGERGIIYDDNLTVGLTVMPPNIQYPEHQHLAEEFYLVMTDGSWKKEGEDWKEKKLGDYVYNESNIKHATKSGDKPLVTLWFHYHPNDFQRMIFKFKDGLEDGAKRIVKKIRS